MIIYDLNCNHGHAFEGWFKSPESFEQQSEAGLLSCPHCGSVVIQRVPSAVHLAKHAASPMPLHEASRLEELAPEEKRFLLRQAISKLISNSEDVGRNFSAEARRIHYLEAPRRPIRGEASLEEYRELQDEGIEVLLLPHDLKNEFH